MKQTQCYVASVLDTALAESSALKDLEYSKQDIASLRSWYDSQLSPETQKMQERDPQSLTLAEIEQYANTLREFYDSEQAKAIGNITKTSTSLADRFMQTVRDYNKDAYKTSSSASQIIKHRAESIAREASEVAQDMLNDFKQEIRGKSLKPVSKLDIFKGIYRKGEYRFGEKAIFQKLYNNYAKRYLDSLSEGKEYEAREYKKILDNWGTLCMYARMVLTRTEGIKLGAFNDYADAVDIQDFEGIVSALEGYDIEEDTKEAWMERKDKTSSFNSLGLKVRSVISSLYQPRSSEFNKQGIYELETDDLDNPILVDPFRVHNTLISVFRGMTSADRMMQILKQEANNPARTNVHNHICAQVYAKLLEDPTLQTEFFVNYKKGFTPYMQITRAIEKGVVKFKSISLNQAYSTGEYEYAARLTRGRLVDPNNPFLKLEKGQLVISGKQTPYTYLGHYVPTRSNEKWETFKSRASKYLLNEIKENEASTEEGRRANKYSILIQLSALMNIEVSPDVLSTMQAHGNLGKFIGALLNLYNPHLSAKGGILDASSFTDAAGNIYSPLFAPRYFTKKKEGEENPMAEFRKKIQAIYKYIDNAKSAEYESRARIMDKHGKQTTVFSNQTPCFFTDIIDTIMDCARRGDKEGLSSYIMKKYGDSSYFYNKDKGWRNIWIREWLKGDASTISEAAQVLEHYRFAQEGFGTDIIRFEELSSKDHMMSMIQQFFYSGSFKEDVNYANYPIFVLGDSGIARFIKAPTFSVEDVVNHLYEVFEQEKTLKEQLEAVDKALKEGNISDTNKVGKSKRVVHREGLKQGQSFNYQMLSFLGSKERIEELMQQSPETVKTAIKEALKEKTQAFKQKLTNLGLLETALATKTILEDGQKTKVEYQVYKEFGKLPHFQGEKNVEVTKSNIDEVLLFYYANNTLAMSQQLQLMTVSPNFYKSTEDLQKRYKEIHASGTPLNLQARYIDGAGKERSVFDGNYYETAVYFDDIITDSQRSNPNFYKIASEKAPTAYKNYLKNTLTDGQSYRTIDSYRKIAIAQGLWDVRGEEEQLYQQLLSFRRQAMQDPSKKLTAKQIKTLSRLAVVIQPQKPYLYTFEQFGVTLADESTDFIKIPVQHKCAEVILIPEFLGQNSPLRHIAEAMRDNGIDVLCSTEVVKVGKFGATEIAYKTNDEGLLINSYGEILPGSKGGLNPVNREDQKKLLEDIKKGKAKGLLDESELKNRNLPVNLLHGSTSEGHIKEQITNALSKGYAHKLSLENYYRQQNVPEHIYDSRRVGTQMRKVFFDRIKAAGNNYERYLTTGGYKGTTVNIAGNHYDLSNKSGNGGRNLARFYNSLIVANIMDAFDHLVKQVSSSKDVSNALQQMVINSSEETFFSLFDYALTGDDKFLTPLYDSCLEYGVSSKLISLFRQKVQIQKMCGGSAVQASAFGIDSVIKDAHSPNDGGLQYVYEYDKEGNPINILYMECEIPFDLRYTDASGKEVALVYEDYVYTREDEEAGRGREGELKVDDEGNTLLEKEFPGILDLIAYRIPTERAYSMMNLKVKRFSRKETGGIIRVPSEGTTIAGFDFDIDKLYFLRKEFKYRSLSEKETKAVWDQIYRDNPLLEERLRELQERQGGIDAAMASVLKEKYKGEHAKELATALEEGRRIFKHEYWDVIDRTELPGIDPNMTKEEFFQQELTKQGKGRGVLLEYDYTKDVRDQQENQYDNKIVRNNEIFNLLWYRLSDAETLETRLNPGGFENSKKAAKLLRILLSPKLASKVTNQGHVDADLLQEYLAKDDDYKTVYDPLDPYTLVAYNQQNQIAGTLIGVFANHNCNHMFASMAEELRCPSKISFCGQSFDDLLHSPKGRDTSLTTAEFLASSVDAVKDPVLNFLNLNRFTANTGALLARIGYTPEEIGLLFNQPLIKEACMLASTDRYLTLQGAIDEVVAKYNQGVKLSNNKELVSKQHLLDNISNSSLAESKEDWIKANLQGQLAALAVFHQASIYAQKLTEFVASTKFTAQSSIGATWGDLYHTQFTVDKYIKSQNSADADNLIITASAYNKLGIQKENQLVSNADLYFQDVINNPFAFEQCVYDCMRGYMQQLCSSNKGFFPYESPLYKEIRNTLNNCTRYENISADTINDIHNYILEEILRQQSGSAFNGMSPIQVGQDEEGNPKYITKQQYYSEYFPQILYLIMHGQGDYASESLVNLKQFFYFNTGENGKIVGMGVRDIMRLSADDKMTFANIWTSLALADDVRDRALARDLFLYCFHTQGFRFGPTSFLHLATAPVRQLIEVTAYNSATKQHEVMPYIQFLSEALYGDVKPLANVSRAQEMVRKYITTHPDKFEFVYSPKSQTEISECKADGNFKVKDGILTINLNPKVKTSRYLKKIILSTTEESTKFIPCIQWDNKLYEIISDKETSDSNEFDLFNELFVTEGTSTVMYREVVSETMDEQAPSIGLESLTDVYTGTMEVRELKESSKSKEASQLTADDYELVTKETKLYLGPDGQMRERC